MLIFKNKGFLVPFYVLVSLLGTAITVGVLKRNFTRLSALEPKTTIVIGIGLIISSIWTYLTREDFVKNKWGEKILIEMKNEFYFLSMKTWSFILFVGGVCLSAYGILEKWL